MFEIDNTMAIKLSRGDSVKFPLFLNRGTSKVPIRYEFYTGQLYADTDFVTVDKQIFETKISIDGSYVFTHDATLDEWFLSDRPQAVILSDYGIQIMPGPWIEKFTITYKKQTDCAVYFRLFNINSITPFFEKKFTPETDLYILKDGKTNGDLLLSLSPNDLLLDNKTTLSSIRGGEYVYQIYALLLIDGEYEYQTVTNKNRFYYIDDDYGRQL